MIFLGMRNVLSVNRHQMVFCRSRVESRLSLCGKLSALCSLLTVDNGPTEPIHDLDVFVGNRPMRQGERIPLRCGHIE